MFLQQGEDPDTVVKKIGQEGFEKLLDQSQTLADYMLSSLQSQVEFESEAGRAKMVQLAKPLMQKIQAPVFRQLLQKRLSVLIGLELEFFAEQAGADQVLPVSAEYSLPESSSPVQSLSDQSSMMPPVSYQGHVARIKVSLNAVDQILSLLIYCPAMLDELDMSVLINSGLDCHLLDVVVPHLRNLKIKDFYHAYSCLQEQGLAAKIQYIVDSDAFWLPKNLGYSSQQLSQQLRSIILNLSAAQPTEAYELLKQRVLARDPALTEDDKILYKKLLKERK